MIDLASILVYEREQRGLSLRAAAKSIGISNPYLSQLETGKVTNPTLDVIQRLTQLYKIKPEVWMRMRVTPNEAPLSALRSSEKACDEPTAAEQRAMGFDLDSRDHEAR